MTTPAMTTVDAFLAAVAAKAPTPGGGAVSAVVGALAAAIGEMAISYSIGRKATPQFDAELTRVIGELTRARAVMLKLVVEDQEAFAELSAAKKLPSDDPTRAARVSEGAEMCIAVPRSIAATALAMLRHVEPIIEKSNKWLLSDLAVCVELAMATIRTAHYSVRANLGDVDAAQMESLSKECEEQVRRGVEQLNRCLAHVSAVLVA